MTKTQIVFTKYAERKRRLSKVVADLVPGALSGVATSLLFHPLDTIQGRVQTKVYKPEQVKIKNVFRLLRKTPPKQSLRYVKDLYKGSIGLKLLRQVPAMTIGYGIYGAARDYLKKNIK